MYILKHIQGTRLFYLITDKEYVVGRKNADIVLSDDQSLSRKHAVISVKGDSVILTDCDSKYGTFHNNKKVTSKVDVVLEDKDLVKFGMFESKYEVQVMNIITTASGLTQDQKNNLKNKLDSLRGSLVSHWNNTCTYLTAHEIILTIKVLHALMDDKPMVTPQYWEQFLKNITDSKPPPNTEDFKPPVTEALINKVNLSANPSRKTLFKGKVFIFPTEKIKKKMADLITKAGGSSISWQKQPLSILSLTQSKNKYIFIRDETDEVPSSLKNVHEHLTKLGERMIPIQEIAMAIVFCSCEKDCNPKFNRLHNVFKMRMDSQSDVFSLAPNTPSEYEYDVGITKKEVIIPESLEADCDLFITPIPVSNTPKPSTPAPSTSKSAEQPKINNAEKVSTVKSSTNNTKTPFSLPNSAPSTSKKIQEVDNPPPKRMRLEDGLTGESSSGSSSSRNSNTSTDVIISKKRPTDESLTSVSKQTSLSAFFKQESLSQSKKRKADETLGSSRKKATKANPFAFLRKKKEEAENPFAAFRVKKEFDKDDADNQFLQILNQPPEKSPVVDSGTPTEIKPLTYDSNLSYVPSSECSKIKWISTSIKNENENSCIVESELDPEVKEIFEKFKDTVIIETIPATSFRVVPPRYTPVSLDSSGNGKNFKKFRKVQPRHPQTTILVTSFREAVREETHILLSDGEEEQNVEDDVVEEPIQPVRRPAKLKKSSNSTFNF